MGIITNAVDNSLVEKVQEIERQFVHQSIRDELQKLIQMGHACEDWDGESDEEPDDMPALTHARSDYHQAEILILTPPPNAN